MMLPSTRFAGTLVADPEMRFTPTGLAVVNARIACNDRKQENGQWVDTDPTFLNIAVWRSLAENLVESAGKGDRVVGWGRLVQQEWTTPEGQKRTSYEVQVDEIGMDLRFRSMKVERGETAAQHQPMALQPQQTQSDQPPW